MELSKSQVDRLGERLREGSPTEADRQLLEEHKRSFSVAYEFVLEKLHRLTFTVQGRPEKSTPSIVAKLRRGTMKLSQMQDIAGCRVIVGNIAAQDQMVQRLKEAFSLPDECIKDRRERPSYGYRAVHIIAKISRKPVEIQIRTVLQQLWAELSERAFDVVDPAIKYGGGPEDFRNELAIWSKDIADYESAETDYLNGRASITQALDEQQELELAYRRASILNKMKDLLLAIDIIKKKEIGK